MTRRNWFAVIIGAVGCSLIKSPESAAVAYRNDAMEEVDKWSTLHTAEFEKAVAAIHSGDDETHAGCVQRMAVYRENLSAASRKLKRA